MAKATDHWDIETDIVVVGSGGGALTSAIVARERGAQVVLLECTDKIGGTTSVSAGIVWIANNHHIAELDLKDSRENGLTYIRRMSAGTSIEELLLAFVDTAPQMLKYIEGKTSLKMEVIRPCPDYYPELPGGTIEGRSLQPTIFDTKLLGDWRPSLRLSPHMPIPTTFCEMRKWGGMLNMAQWDWALLGQRMEEGIVGFGSALIGPLMEACLDRKVNILLQTRGRELLRDGTNRIVGIRAEQGGHTLSVKGRLGVILACGGYEWNEDLRRLSGSPTTEAWTVPSNRGDGHIMGLEVGAAWAHLDDPAGPCLAIPGETYEGGQPLYRSFFADPVRPGMIIVNRQGRRFANEGLYKAVDEEIVRLDASNQTYPNLPCFAIYDHHYKTKYAIGTIMPQDEAPGWMNGSPSLRELALKLEVDPDNLEKTISTFNTYAREGEDPDYKRGTSAYAQFWGDPLNKPNPSLGPIEKPPFYGFQLVRAAAGTKSGLVTNGKAQVMSVRGEVVPGLYAVPNVAAHLALGRGMTSGMTHAQSMTFGYIASLHMTE